MNLYHLWQDQTTGYDTYDSCVVAAPTKRIAIKLNPDGDWDRDYTAWAKTPDKVYCELIGKAAGHVKQGIIISSFNAG